MSRGISEYVIGLKIGQKTVVEVLAWAAVMHVGWELDNDAWAVKFDDGSIDLLTTNHGSISDGAREELQQKLEETEQSAAQLRQLLNFK